MGNKLAVLGLIVLIILLLTTGLYFTFRTRFVQFRMFLESIRVVGEKPEKAGATSSFQALMVSTASRRRVRATAAPPIISRPPFTAAPWRSSSPSP